MADIHPDITRLQPTSDSLNVLLKNTHFKDNLLDSGSKIGLQIKYHENLPILIFSFHERYYDFLEVIDHKILNGSHAWLDNAHLTITLVLADPVITDQVSSRIFRLDVQESQRLRERLREQEGMESVALDRMTAYVRQHASVFLS
ncbi:hypothetical protein DYBT9275_02361 [Dyadobacter sp. CECT 9275]|uniref:Uncharacterized protein n=1 Tax=Dyadobacter helix TaxID=2822344 RepID=A0A916JCY5_9BACT|nr:hypothetical protein [Dyadobacter sp. CECT 9275]CAG4999989.1 hypothetical protein DYBT9275_02361 [Dyadobacter sp. CECT 9275]